jgi:polyferredoxin
MDQMGYEPGLVGYTTEHALEGGKTHIMRPRFIAYSAVLVIMIAAFAATLASRTAFELDIIRDRGSLYQYTPNNTVRNAYTLNLINMSQHPVSYRIKIEGLNNPITDIPDIGVLKSNDLRTFPISIEMDPTNLTGSRTDIELVIFNQESQEEIAREESRFIAPIN